MSAVTDVALEPSAGVSRQAQRAPILTIGMVVWLASELMFFSSLFAAYFTLRSVNKPWPPKGTHIQVGLAATFTVVLILSSATMQLGVRAIKRGDRRALRLWVLATLVLGAVFVANQFREYASVSFTMSSNAFGSAFFVLTGFHTLHVIAGLILMLVLLARAVPTSFGAGETPSVEVVSYYWHFVDVVWIALFSTIYLLK